MLSGQGGGTHLCTTTWKPYIETEESEQACDSELAIVTLHGIVSGTCRHIHTNMSQYSKCKEKCRTALYSCMYSAQHYP